MKCISLTASGRRAGRLAPLPLLLLAAAAHAQTPTQPIKPTDGLPTLTYAFNHTSVVSIANVAYDFNYYDFNITGFTKVGRDNPYYDILSLGNTTLEKQPSVVAVASAYLPKGWTFNDSHDFLISILPGQAIHADDPQFGLIFIQTLGSTPISPYGAPFHIYHQEGGADPFTLNGTPVVITATPEASTTVSFGLLLALGMGGLVIVSRRKHTASG